MGVTGLEIFKLLPKTNCKECGFPTCLAFAMQVAMGKVELAKCPYVSEEAKEKLAEVAAPPIRTVTIGDLKVGGETVAFRHEKRFENPPGIGVLISDAMEEGEVERRLKLIQELQYERIGLILKADVVALRCDSGDPERFSALAQRAAAADGLAIVLVSEDPKLLAAAGRACGDKRPLLCGATLSNVEDVASLAKELGCPVGARASSLEELAQLTAKLTEAGVKDIVLDSGATGLKQAFQDQVIIRKLALEKKFRPLGFPTILFTDRLADDPMKEALAACTFIAKYGGIIILSDLAGHSLFPLLVARLNIYTDPQRPLATTEGIYEIGNPDEHSPVLITTNFSLTYFIVSGEIANSRVPSWLLVKDTEGLSVMTAWAAGKFNADTVAPFVKKCGIAEKVKHRKLVIPGYAAGMGDELAEELGDWEVLIGPREAAQIPAYLKEWNP